MAICSCLFALLVIIIGTSYLRVTIFLDLFLCRQESGEGGPYSRRMLPSLSFCFDVSTGWGRLLRWIASLIDVYRTRGEGEVKPGCIELREYIEVYLRLGAKDVSRFADEVNEPDGER